MHDNSNIIKLKSIACWFDTDALLIYSCKEDGDIDYENHIDVLSLQPEWFKQLLSDEKELISNYIKKK